MYLLSKASPIVSPASNQYNLLVSKIALYKQINESVQNKINGTSGVELKLRIVTNTEVQINKKALVNFFFDKNKEANL